jgi:hypothetical protein
MCVVRMIGLLITCLVLCHSARASLCETNTTEARCYNTTRAWDPVAECCYSVPAECENRVGPLDCEIGLNCTWTWSACINRTRSAVDVRCGLVPTGALCDNTIGCEYDPVARRCVQDRLDACPSQADGWACERTTGCIWILTSCRTMSRAISDQSGAAQSCWLYDADSVICATHAGTACAYDAVHERCEVAAKSVPLGLLADCHLNPVHPYGRGCGNATECVLGCAPKVGCNATHHPPYYCEPVSVAVCPLVLDADTCLRMDQCAWDSAAATCTVAPPPPTPAEAARLRRQKRDEKFGDTLSSVSAVFCVVALLLFLAVVVWFISTPCRVVAVTKRQ